MHIQHHEGCEVPVKLVGVKHPVQLRRIMVTPCHGMGHVPQQQALTCPEDVSISSQLQQQNQERAHSKHRPNSVSSTAQRTCSDQRSV